MSARLGRPCLFVTSCRLAVYLALRKLLSPGDRILMSDQRRRFGDAAAFSLSKYVGAPCGGVLAFADERERPQLERLRDLVTTEGLRRVHAARAGAYAAERLVVGMNMVWLVRRLRRRLGMNERAGFRMPLRAVELRRTIARAPDVDRFGPWMAVDRRDYRLRPSGRLLGVVLHRPRRLDADRARRLEGVERLRALPIVAPERTTGSRSPCSVFLCWSTTGRR